jgi:triacylglycerol esterase/lipase EstA (alpha/beta hydrolase family)
LGVGLLILGVLLPFGAAVDPASAGERASVLVYSSPNQPGPALDVPLADLSASVQCTANATDASREVVLFVPGTTATPIVNFGWNWFPALDKLRWPYCSVTLPKNAMGDMQQASEYVVYAIRHVYAISGRKVVLIGHSQGGVEPRFALRFWPDTRPMVDDYIALDATNHGTVIANALCAPVVGCAPAIWQQTYESSFTQAMNSYQETFPGISYTDIYTRTDDIVQPNLNESGSTSLHGGGGEITNVAIQDICPLDVSEHLAIGTYDPVAYAIVMDALTHAGPANPARINRSVCGELFMPGINLTTFVGDYAEFVSHIVAVLATYPHATSAPTLAPFVYSK